MKRKGSLLFLGLILVLGLAAAVGIVVAKALESFQAVLVSARQDV
jgi:hypothetical protein